MWQSFADGVSKETVPIVVSGGDGQCLLFKQDGGGGQEEIKTIFFFKRLPEVLDACWVLPAAASAHNSMGNCSCSSVSPPPGKKHI